MQQPRQPFSKRQGYVGRPKEISIREDAPKDFRFAFLHATRVVARQYQGDYPEVDIRDVVAKTLQMWLDPGVWHYNEAWQQVEGAVYGCEWFRVYDIVESIEAYFKSTTPRAATEFTNQLNELFVGHGIGWQLVNGEIVTRGGQVFEVTVTTAIALLQQDRKPTAAGHLQFAIGALSARPTANTSGAVAQATNAVECVLGEITGQTMTLGDYLKKNASLFHPALAKGLRGIYGYASDEGARHGKEGTAPTREDAEFVVSACAAVCTLLTRKHPK